MFPNATQFLLAASLLWAIIVPGRVGAQTISFVNFPKTLLDEPGQALPEFDIHFHEMDSAEFTEELNELEEEPRLFCFDLQAGSVFHGSNIGDFLGDLTGGSVAGRMTLLPDSELAVAAVDGNFSAYGGVTDWSTSFSLVRPWYLNDALSADLDLGVAFDLMGAEGTLGAPGSFFASHINFAAGMQLTPRTYGRALYTHPTSGQDLVFRPIDASGFFIAMETRRKFQAAFDHRLTDNLLVTAYWTHFAEPDQHFVGFGVDWFLNDTTYLFGTAHFGEGGHPTFGTDSFAFAGIGFRWGGCRPNSNRPLFELGRPNLDISQGSSVLVPAGGVIGIIPDI